MHDVRMICFALIALTALAACGGIEEPQDAQLAGETEDAIRYGTAAPEAINVVAIFTDEGQCSGAIIRSNVVLTAAHCVHGLQPNRISVTQVGELRFHWNGYASVNNIVPVYVDRVVVHPSFEPDNPARAVLRRDGLDTSIVAATRGFDIALIRLETHLAAPPFALAGSLGDLGESVTAFGYGESLVEPANSLGTRRRGLVVTNGHFDQPRRNGTYLADAVIAAAPGGTNQTTCPGDSGGPLIRTAANGSHRLLGVTSGGIGNTCFTTTRSFFTSVPAVRTWILEQMAAL